MGQVSDGDDEVVRAPEAGVPAWMSAVRRVVEHEYVQMAPAAPDAAPEHAGDTPGAEAGPASDAVHPSDVRYLRAPRKSHAAHRPPAPGSVVKPVRLGR